MTVGIIGDETSETGDEQGFGAMETERGNLPLSAVDVEATIVDLIAETSVRQTFENPYDEPLEATYVFPLPPRAGVTSFEATFDDRTIEGVLKERGEARREYRQAVEQGKRASIVEEERPDVFTMRVGNIAPGETAAVEMTMSGPLAVADGEATFRFPLVVAPRYVPGEPVSRPSSGSGTASDTDAVPDASRVTPPVLLPGFPNPVDLSIDVHFEESSLTVRNLRSTLHAIDEEERAGGRHLKVVPGDRDEEGTVRLDRDFILRFDVAGDAIASSARWTPDEDAEAGTFGVTLVPPEAGEERAPRDVVFVLDRSGSMDGWKMVAARRAIGRMVDSLTPDDRFQLLLFDDRVERAPGFEGDGLIEATDRNRYRVVEKLGEVEARGGTEMLRPLQAALALLDDSYQMRRQSVVLVTDGQVANEDEIAGEVRREAGGASIQAVGIDQAVNSGFLNRLTDATGGRCELVESEDRLDEAMSRIHRTIASPVVTELSMAMSDGEGTLEAVAPDPLPDLFEGVPVRIFGRRSAGSGAALTLSGALSDGTTWRETLPMRETESGAIATVWARQRVRDLEDRYRARRHGDAERETLEEEIVETSLAHGVMCRFTAFVAVDDSEETVDGERREVTQPVEQPAGWEMDAMAAAPPPTGVPQAPAPTRSRAKAEATDAPQMMRGMQQASADAGDADSFGGGPGAGPHGSTGPRQGGSSGSAIDRTAAYLAPEQRRGDGGSPRADVYSLGIIAFELLTGEQLCSDAELMMHGETWSWDPSRIHQYANRLAPFTAVIGQALAEDPADRFADAAAFLEAFGDVVSGMADGPDRDDLAGWSPLAQLAPTTLDALLRRVASMPRPAALWIVEQVAEQLADLHRQGDSVEELAGGHLAPRRVAVEADGGVALEGLEDEGGGWAFWK